MTATKRARDARINYRVTDRVEHDGIVSEAGGDLALTPDEARPLIAAGVLAGAHANADADADGGAGDAETPA